jgi:hypothetical protein
VQTKSNHQSSAFVVNGLVHRTLMVILQGSVMGTGPCGYSASTCCSTLYCSQTLSLDLWLSTGTRHGVQSHFLASGEICLDVERVKLCSKGFGSAQRQDSSCQEIMHVAHFGPTRPQILQAHPFYSGASTYDVGIWGRVMQM